MKIYSFKATGNGARITGRIKASDMQDATNQVVLAIHGRPMDIIIGENIYVPFIERTVNLHDI